MGKNASYSLKIIKSSLVGNRRRKTYISPFSAFHMLLVQEIHIDNDKKIEALVRYLARKLCPSHLLLVTAQRGPTPDPSIIYGGPTNMLDKQHQ